MRKDDDVFFEGGKNSKKNGKKNDPAAIRKSKSSIRIAKADDDMSIDGVPLLKNNHEMFDDLTLRKYFAT